MIVYLDSNILFSDPYLFSNKSKTILDKISASRGKLKIPYVVYQETLNNLLVEVSINEKSLLKNVKDISKKLVGSGILNSMNIPSFDEDSITRSYNRRYEELVQAGLVEIINHKSMNQEELIDDILYRALNGIRPFAPKKEEFKDTIIWKTIIADIVSSAYKNCIFLSNNTSDFYNKDKTSLHDHLINDVPAGVNLNTYMSINELLASPEFLSDQKDIEVLINSKNTSGVIPEVLLKITRKINDSYLITKLSSDYLVSLQTELMSIFNYIASDNEEQFHSYFPLIDVDTARPRLMKVNPNYFMDEVDLEIIEIQEFDVITEERYVIVLCRLIVVTKLKMLKDVYMPKPQSNNYDSAKLVISMSFSINLNEEFEDFDISYCAPMYY